MLIRRERQQHKNNLRQRNSDGKDVHAGESDKNAGYKKRKRNTVFRNEQLPPRRKPVKPNIYNERGNYG